VNSSFILPVAYSHFAIFNIDNQQPFTEWSSQHVAQGFTWRSDSVCFATLGDGRIQVEVQQSNDFSLAVGTIRAIRVPFSVSDAALVDIESPISDDTNLIPVSTGSYALFYETGYLTNQEVDNKEEGEDREYYERTMWCRLTFIPNDSVQAEILVADEDLSPTYPLLMTAQPA